MFKSHRHSARALAASHPAIIVCDLDNVTVAERGGFDQIDIARFCAKARVDAGRDCIIKIFVNGMTEACERVWNSYGADVIRTRVNADPVIIDYLFAMERAHRVIIVSGDHAFAHAAAWHRSIGHHVSVWSRRARAAYELIFAADSVEFCIDGLLRVRRPAARAA